MKKYINQLFLSTFFTIVFCFYSVCWATGENMRSCLILPIIDELGGATSMEIMDNLETYLKDSTWCYYKSNSEMINILSQYKKDLKLHLSTPAVLQTIAKKMHAGSLIRIKLSHLTTGVELEMHVVAQNGEDIYFHEKAFIDDAKSTLLSQRLISWLEVFASTIPYNAQVLGIVGNQVQLDAGNSFNVSVGDKIFILRPLKKKRHPLLNEIVEWEKMEIGRGEVFNVMPSESVGIIIESKKGYNITRNDWVQIQHREQPQVLFGEESNEELKPKDFGRLGEISVLLNIGPGVSSSLIENKRKKMGGLVFGINGQIELWATRNIFGGIELEKDLASYKKTQGELNQETSTLAKNMFKFKFGYKYLPLGHFYGPQVDGYLGYAKINYGFDTSVSDGFTDVNFNGILFGIKGSAPLLNSLRISIGLEFLMFTKYLEEDVVLGQAKEASSYQIDFGAHYEFSERTFLLGHCKLQSEKANFSGGRIELHHQVTLFSIGLGYIF